jgi:peptidoglycan-N-acetylglucosamine deacetylase
MLTFRNTTLAFFILLFTLNILSISGIPVHYLLYILLITLYLGISVTMSFFIRSGYHMPAYCNADTSEKIVALTFDDGPDPQLTPAFLDVMKKLGIPAAFFCIGKNIVGNERILQRMHSEGHLIGTHSYFHSNWFDLFPPCRMRHEIENSTKAVFGVTGRRPLFFRPPYGVINPMLRRALHGSGLHVIGFSNRAWDTSSRNPEVILSRILKKISPGDIILLHDTIKENLGMIVQLKSELDRKGYRIVPLDELLNLPAYES